LPHTCAINKQKSSCDAATHAKHDGEAIRAQFCKGAKKKQEWQVCIGGEGVNVVVDLIACKRLVAWDVEA